MTQIQISAILYLLLAFGVPQTTVNTVQGILLNANKQTTTAPLPGTGGVGQISGVQLNTMESDSTLQPAYTWDELLHALFAQVPDYARTGQQSLYQNSYPVQIQVSSTTANIGWDGPSATWGEIVFDGNTVLDKVGNTTPVLYEGQTLPIGSRTWTQINDLTPNTTYSYQFVWKEAGRNDTVITKTFKTSTQ